jgi:PAS domain S-box-containing protein
MPALAKHGRTIDALREENADLRTRLEASEEMLAAIRTGQVDAITVETPEGLRVFTLKGADQPYRVMVETMSEGAVTVTPDDVILYSNQRFADMLGAGLDTIIGSSLLSHFADDDAGRIAAAFIKSQTETPRLQATLVSSDGTRIPVNVAMHNHGGAELHDIAAVITDLTELVASQKALAELNHELRVAFHYARSLIEASLDPLVTISADGKITDVNKATESVTGVARDNLIGSDFSDYFTEPGKARAGYRKVFAEGTVTDYELAIRHTSGRITDVLYNASTYHDENGEVAGVFAAARDVTQRRRTEAELALHHQHLEELVATRTADLAQANQGLEVANRELESFAYSVSHDLRTPLRAIDGFSQILVREYADRLDTEGKRILQVVRNGATRMGILIDDILAFSRVGRQAIEAAETDMASLVRDTLHELAPIMADRAIEVKVGKLPQVRGDRLMLQRVWTNLLENAIKFSGPKPDAVIEIGARADGDETEFFVRDNGVGFDMRYAGKLFGVFQRLHGVEEVPGTGIGLAIVHRIVTRHGGRVSAEGKVGTGATFRFTLPHAVARHA